LKAQKAFILYELKQHMNVRSYIILIESILYVKKNYQN